jgi:hypothetical protein
MSFSYEMEHHSIARFFHRVPPWGLPRQRERPLTNRPMRAWLYVTKIETNKHEQLGAT